MSIRMPLAQLPTHLTENQQDPLVPFQQKEKPMQQAKARTITLQTDSTTIHIAPHDSPRRRSFKSDRSLLATISAPIYLKRLFRFGQMDFELALWQMSWLCVAPRKVYRNIYYHKQTKNQWARDDPAFVVLLSGMLLVVAMIYGLVYKMGFWGTIRTMFFMVFVDFLLVGIAVATGAWFVSNKLMRTSNTRHSVDQTVEWAYCFDVHCNAFFPLFLITYVLQLCLISVLAQESWVSLILGNTMYLAATLYYNYITFLGYSGISTCILPVYYFLALPFLQNTILFLYPCILYFIFYLTSLFGFNISRTLLRAYFGN